MAELLQPVNSMLHSVSSKGGTLDLPEVVPTSVGKQFSIIIDLLNLNTPAVAGGAPPVF